VPILGWLPTGIQEIKSNLTSHYDALQFSVTHRYSNGLSFLTAYTWSHAIDTDNAGTGGRNQPLGGYTGDYYNLSSARGNASFDRTHRLVASYAYDLPKGKWDSKPLRALLNDWSVSGVTTIQSGVPFSITDSTSGTIYGISTYAQFAAGKGPKDAVGSGSTTSRLNNYFNTAAFTAPPIIGDGTGWGNAGRNILRGPGQINFDSSIGRVFAVGGLSESGRLEFRSEFFNLFNHAQFANPTANRGASSTFGVISTTVVAPRIAQLALKYVF
jgi:hypothetical protein